MPRNAGISNCSKLKLPPDGRRGEKRGRAKAESRAAKAEEAAQRAEHDLDEEKKRNLFLSSIATLDTESVVNLHHQIVIYAADVSHLVALQLERLNAGEAVSKADQISMLEHVSFQIQKILAASRFATKANFRLDAEEIHADVASYIVQYVERVCPLHAGDGARLSVHSTVTDFVRRFKPIELSMVIDNLISNARKAGARRISFELSRPSKQELVVAVADNGSGLQKSIKDSRRIFEKGFTTTDGSGLGLYFVSEIVDQLGGTVDIDTDAEQGARFVIRLRRK